MPRRLGDSPLARARNVRASKPVVAEHSSNDLFLFQRRGVVESFPEPQGIPEISEISEIPAMREAASPPTEVVASAPISQPSEPSSFIEGVVARLNETAPPAAPAPTQEALTPPDPAPTDDSGFIKRLLDKLK